MATSIDAAVPTACFAQEYATDTGNSVNVNRLYYSFPVGETSPSLVAPWSVWTTCCRCGPAPIRLT